MEMNERDEYVLAIDIGTQSVRAAVVDARGGILEMSQISQEVQSPQQGWAQQQPDQWWEMTCRAIRDVLTRVQPEAIVSVCSCGQMHGPVGIDEEGGITTEWVQLWCDKRCEEQCERVRGSLDEVELSSVTANPVTAGWVGMKVRWIAEYLPDVYRKSRWFLVPKDFINFRLTGIAATDPSEASGTYLWDADLNTYSPKMAEMLGLDLSKFAPVYDSHESIGTVTATAARETGLPIGVPVMAGGGDFLVSLLGIGIGEGIAVDITGTSTLFVVHREKPLVHPSIQNLRHVIGGWVLFTMLDCGGLSMKWCSDFISSARGVELSYEELVEMASGVEPGSEGLFFYPYMLGERRSENTMARGGFFGITLNHRAAHFVRSVMEGTAFALGRDARIFRRLGVTIHRVYSVGGGSRNRLLNQMKANVLQVPVELFEEPEASIRGAGILGAFGVGLIDRIDLTEQRDDSVIIEPHHEESRLYERILIEYERIYNHMLGFWQ
jgi:xylulokinase